MDADTACRRKPQVVLREELDDWALLYNPDDGSVAGVNAVGAAIWRILEHRGTIPDIVEALRECCEELPPDVETQVLEYLASLSARGFIVTAASAAL